MLPAICVGLVACVAGAAASLEPRWAHERISPKVMVFSYGFCRGKRGLADASRFYSDENVWVEPFSLTKNVTVPGLSPLYPEVQCSEDSEVCHMTTGEAEINAAVSTTVRSYIIGQADADCQALLLSDKFNFTQTYLCVR